MSQRLILLSHLHILWSRGLLYPMPRQGGIPLNPCPGCVCPGDTEMGQIKHKFKERNHSVWFFAPCLFRPALPDPLKEGQTGAMWISRRGKWSKDPFKSYSQQQDTNIERWHKEKKGPMKYAVCLGKGRSFESSLESKLQLTGYFNSQALGELQNRKDVSINKLLLIRMPKVPSILF